MESEAHAESEHVLGVGLVHWVVFYVGLCWSFMESESHRIRVCTWCIGLCFVWGCDGHLQNHGMWVGRSLTESEIARKGQPLWMGRII